MRVDIIVDQDSFLIRKNFVRLLEEFLCYFRSRFSLISTNERIEIQSRFLSLQDVKRDTCASRTGRIIRRIGVWKKGRGFRSCWGAHFRMHARSLSPLSHYLKLQSIDRRRDGAETCLCPTWSQYK